MQLIDDLYTINNSVVGDEIKLRRIVRIISDISPIRISNLRILDLACLEGLYSIELALHGATVVGIEGREANIEKARFAKDVLALNSLELCHEDVRSLSRKTYGSFDVVLCLGILYHLGTPDIFEFIGKVSEVCEGFAVIDTHISLTGNETCIYDGKEYHGSYYQEHIATATPEEKLKAHWSSLDNDNSFWPTRNSLYNLLSHAGFTSVYECHNPPEIGKPADRVTLLALKGSEVKLLSSPDRSLPETDWPEK